MSNEGETLGKPVAWQIRDVPEAIRDAVVDQAHVQRINVAQLLTQLVLAARARGWDFSAPNGFADSSNMPAGNGAAVDEACRLADSVAKLAEAAGDRKPRGALQAAARLLRQQVEARTATAAPGIRKALPAPADA